MRLINTRTFDLCEFIDDEIPERYAILSHRWGNEEVTFQDWQVLSVAKAKKGFAKIDMACKQAQKHGLDYLWVDTNCIDKASSTELSEAVNSMFRWYQRSTVCYAYLSDVESSPGGFDMTNKEDVQEFSASEWFKRGWTLQELLAPVTLIFYSRGWSEIAPRSTMADLICETTRIDTVYLHGDEMFKNASIAQKMSWVSRRETKRIEDMAYCMLGIFDVNLPLLYGEGRKSFIRLQEEIIRTANDQSIFCWTWTDLVPAEWVSLLAPCPQAFQYSEGFINVDSKIFNRTAFKVTNSGLSITLPVVRAWSYYLGILNASIINSAINEAHRLVCVPVGRHSGINRATKRFTMRRLRYPPGPLPVSTCLVRSQLPMYIWSIPGPTPDRLPLASRNILPGNNQYSFLLVFDHLEKFKLQSSGIMEPSNTTGSMEPRNHSSGLHVFPPHVFDGEKGLVTVNRTSTSSGALIRLETDGKTCTLFLGLGFRFCRPYRFCGIVPELIAKATLDDSGLLKKSLELAAKQDKEIYASWGHGIGVAVAEEAVTTAGSIYLVYITCDYTNTNPRTGRL